jgi:hypothetical protein
VGLNGQSVDGYVYQLDIQQPVPTSPADAATVEQKWTEKYPNGKTVTIYKSDGKTVIGTWAEGNPDPITTNRRNNRETFKVFPAPDDATT